MQAQYLDIEARVRVNDVAFVQPTDFQVRRGATADPQRIVTSANVSLYCFDHERGEALFVETPPEVDLAAAPFLYQAQYQHAQRLIAVPYETLHALADAVRFDARRLILIYSTGRCGSTLVSRAFNQAQGVASYSEPDVYSQLSMLREPDGSNAAQIGALLRSATLVTCAAATSAGAQTVALKFRSFGIGFAELFQQHFPAAKVVFLYRNAAPWALSVGRAFGFFSAEVLPWMPEFQSTFARLIPQVAAFGTRHERTITPAELLACMWVSVMEGGRTLRRLGAPMFAARYEDVKRAPRELLDALFAHCDVVARSAAAIDAVLAADAQSGTSVAQDVVSDAAGDADDDHVAEVCRRIPDFGAGLHASSTIADSFVPEAPASSGHNGSTHEAAPSFSSRSP